MPADTRPIPINLSSDEIEKLDKMAGELNASRHALLLFVVRDFIDRWENEGYRPPTQQTLVIK